MGEHGVPGMSVPGMSVPGMGVSTEYLNQKRPNMMAMICLAMAAGGKNVYVTRKVGLEYMSYYGKG